MADMAAMSPCPEHMSRAYVYSRRLILVDFTFFTDKTIRFDKDLDEF